MTSLTTSFSLAPRPMRCAVPAASDWALLIRAVRRGGGSGGWGGGGRGGGGGFGGARRAEDSGVWAASARGVAVIFARAGCAGAAVAESGTARASREPTAARARAVRRLGRTRAFCRRGKGVLLRYDGRPGVGAVDETD